MGERLQKLLEIAGEAVTHTRPTRNLDRHVGSLLGLRNGFVAFESALLVVPAAPGLGVIEVEAWNSRPERRLYPHWAGATVFAFDVFLDHFASLKNEIVRLNPYSGEVEPHSSDIEAWAAKLLGDYDFETGWSVARAWQSSNRPLRYGERLIPKVPFILGGKYEVENLVAVAADVAMGPIADLYVQLRDMPDGGQVELHGWTPSGW